MAKTKKSHRRSKRLTIPLAVIAGFLPLASRGITGWRTLGGHGVALYLTNDLTGYNLDTRTWNMGEMLKGWTAPLLGFFAHSAANKLGINRAIARAGIPFVRI